MSSAPLSTKPEPNDRRRSTRVMLVIPVEVKWMTKDGPWVQEHAETEVVSQHGAMLRMKSRLAAGTQVEIRRPAMQQSVKAKVVGVGNPSTDGLARIAVEMLATNDMFWGISFPPAVMSTAAPSNAPTNAKPAALTPSLAGSRVR